jgi:hypothetical protein
LKDINEILNSYESVQLEQLDSVKLLNRVDTKFVVKACRLSEILDCLKEDYFVLEVNGIRMSEYDTVYYDTPDFFYYYQHQNGRLARVKIRLRTYKETGQSFLEIKIKNNHSKTEKDRISVSGADSLKEKKCKKFLKSKTEKYKEIIPVIDVLYYRTTLVNKNFTERLTIDSGLNFKTENGFADYSGLCIVELKQDKTAKSPVREILRDHRIFKSSLSKYCLGIASLYPQVKRNKIKQKMRLINKLCACNQLMDHNSIENNDCMTIINGNS